MSKRIIWQSCILVVPALSGLAAIAGASVVVDGTVSSGEYGSNTPGSGALSTQTINTGFGDSNYTATPNGPDANGSEMDAAYGVVQNNTLYIALTGAYQNNGNPVNIFIADGRVGQSVLSTTVSPISAMNGSVFSPGFSATYIVNSNDFQGTLYTDVDDLTGTTSSGYLGAITLSSGIGSGTPTGGGIAPNGITLGLNNSLISTMGASGTAASTSAMQSASTGLEVAIPLSLLGSPAAGSNILILADINGGNDSYLSNQFLPGLAVGTQNLGTGTTAYSLTGNSGGFNFGLTPGEYFAVAVPEPASLGVLGVIATGLLGRRKLNN